MKGGRSARMGEGEGQRRSSHKRKGCCQCGCAIEEGMLLQGCVVEGDAIAGWEKEEGGEKEEEEEEEEIKTLFLEVKFLYFQFLLTKKKKD